MHRTSGLLVFTLRDPAQPVLVATLGDPDPTDAVTIEFASELALAEDFAYVVETHRQRDRACRTTVSRCSICGVRSPPGAVSLPVVTRTASSTLETSGAGVTVAGAFAYLARGTLGLQVVDIRHPDALRLVGLLNTPSEALNVTAVGDRLYVLDRVFGLQVVQGPGTDLTGMDGDDIINFFDAFPTDPRETQDTDQDRLGDTADLDNNDGFTDTEEQQATLHTNAADPRSFPVRLPPAPSHHASALAPRRRRTGRSARRSRPCTRAICRRCTRCKYRLAPMPR